MNEIDLVLQKFPSINREDLLILVSILLDYWDNKCPESLTSLRADVDKWCSITVFPDYYLIAHKAIVESEEFFNLLSKVENYEYINGNLRIMGLKVIGTDIKLDEYLEGPSAISFSSDELAPVKIISDFAKKHSALELKAGIVEGKVVAADELSVYAAIPSREGLLTMLAGGMMGIPRDLSICLDLYSQQKEEN